MSIATNLLFDRNLIFLMVFIALPALQRSQRDTQRRNDLGRVTNAITQYQTNNNGRLPADEDCAPVDVDPDKDGADMSSACNLIKRYLNAANSDTNTFVDPSGQAYGMKICTTGANNNKCIDEGKEIDYDHIIYIIKSAACTENETFKKSNNSRDYAILYRLEGGGTYCQGNSGGAATTTNP